MQPAIAGNFTGLTNLIQPQIGIGCTAHSPRTVYRMVHEAFQHKSLWAKTCYAVVALHSDVFHFRSVDMALSLFQEPYDHSSHIRQQMHIQGKHHLCLASPLWYSLRQM